MKDIAVLCTTKCNTGCRHCSFDSMPKGEDMALGVIRELKKSLQECQDQVTVIFTGGGEPLQWPHLPEALSLLKDLPEIVFVLMTSGCLGKNDERFAVLKESLKQVQGKLKVTFSFNLFSPTFPQRLAFTLPFILIEERYRVTNVKMTGGLTASFKDGRKSFSFYFDEIKESMEKSLKEAIGGFAKLVLPPKNTPLLKKMATLFLKEGFGILDYWLEREAFLTPTVYFPYDLAFRDKVVLGFGSYVSTQGRGEKLLPCTAQNAFYNFRRGLDCAAFCEAVVMATNGNFVFCPLKNFPPFSLGRAGGSLKKALQIKKRLALKTLNLLRQDITELGFSPCGNCLRKAWEIFYGMS